MPTLASSMPAVATFTPAEATLMLLCMVLMLALTAPEPDFDPFTSASA